MKTSVPSGAISDYRGQVEDHASALRAAGLLHEELYIGGKWVQAGGGERLEVTDPATGAVLAAVASAEPGDVAEAIAVADAARHIWPLGSRQIASRPTRRWLAATAIGRRLRPG
jgi:succinate-semialdehyde dehydrogenase/glutarate-semialdehyde dehydrogenase